MTYRNLFTVAPLFLLAACLSTSASANDDLLATIAAMEGSTSTTSTQVATMSDDEMGSADVEALLGDDDADQEEAVAACYRRFGRSYGYRSYGYQSYSHNCYNYSYNYCHRPCYTPIYKPCYKPVTYTYCTPVYTNYWGCW